MHESERNRLAKLRKVFILAAADMNQAIAAARTLYESESDDQAYLRMLETALAVCYARPYTKSSLLTLPKEYTPTGVDLGYHKALLDLRDMTYAHTDKFGGRHAVMQTTGEEGDIISLSYREEWLSFPREALPDVMAFFERQRKRFLTAAASAHVDLEDEDV